MDTKERKTGVSDGVRRHRPGARAGPDLGIRHTALAAKNDLEKRNPISRGLTKNFFGKFREEYPPCRRHG
jgi:hypothetical protein